MPRRRLVIAGSILVVILAFLVARGGTWLARGAALAAIAALISLVIALRIRERRVLEDPKRVLGAFVAGAAPAEASRVLRALGLLERPDPGTSRALAELHVARALASIPREDVERRARRVGKGLGFAAVVAGALAAGSCVQNPWGVVEGADVLAARGGVAPLDMVWLGQEELRSRPPDYLHQAERRDPVGEELELPRGTLLTFRGIPIHAGRRLSLTDGHDEVPFVDDGSGAMVARWPLAGDVRLRVVARFGDVIIGEPDETRVTSIPDAAPSVTLEGAPRKISLTTDADASEIPIRYLAEDDHGLREVHLVLRAGTREERRVLSRLDGETKLDRGGYILRPSDPFLKRSHVPVSVQVEAKDNDPVTGPKWGASEAITVVPPDVGEPEAMRLAALRTLLFGYVDVLAYRLESDANPKTFLAEVKRMADSNEDRLQEVLGSTFAGVHVPARLDVLLRALARKLRLAEQKELASLAPATRKAAITANERMVLVLDAILRGLAIKDARRAAKQLADSADELALGATQTGIPKDRAVGTARLDAATQVLEGGRRSLLRLGTLGRDLGEIVSADLLRVKRARSSDDILHAELAARDLALRLRQPDPSFGGASSSQRGGGESGGGRGSPTGDGEGEGGDEVERAFNEAAQELDRLAADHAEAMGKVEQALAEGAGEEERRALGEEAKKHADAIRGAVKDMPSVGAGSDSWTSKGAAGKELAEQMARSLEQGNAADAVSGGRSAAAALDEAKRMAGRSFRAGRDVEDKIEEARRKLAPELRWAEEKLAQMRKRAAEKAGARLGGEAEAEGKLADRARELARKGRPGQGQSGELPEGALEALDAAERAARDAANALKRGDAERGLAEQRVAQSKLEAARQELGAKDDRDEEGRGKSGRSQRDEDGDVSEGHAGIPRADAHKGPEEFRKRVLKGLSQPGSGRHKDAIVRYAEGLLR